MSIKKKYVIIAPRLKKYNTIMFILIAMYSLLSGLLVTIKYFIKSIFISTVTMEYPEKKSKIKISNNFRAKLILISSNKFTPHKCTGCKVCEKACPNKSIYIISHKGISKRIELKNFIWRLDACTFCYVCVIVCPFNALAFKNNFEHAVYDRRLLIYNLNRYIGPPNSYFNSIDNSDQKQNLIKMNLLQPYEQISLQEIIGKC